MGNSGGRDDAALLEAWRRGNTDAGERLMRRHFVDVYRYFHRQLSGVSRGEDAEDLAQKTFEVCIARRDTVRGDFRGYLFGVARRQLWLEWERRRQKTEAVTPADLGVSDVSPSPSGHMARVDECERIAEALEQLPIEFKAVVRRYYWDEQPLRRIAEELGVALGTVKSRLHRGKALLRDALAGVCSSPGVMRWWGHGSRGQAADEPSSLRAAPADP